jgi:hypothetical protein
MKEITMNILWWVLNKLDPLRVVQVSIDIKEIKIKLNKKYWKRDEWTHFGTTIMFWGKINEKGRKSYKEIAIYNNGNRVDAIEMLSK